MLARMLRDQRVFAVPELDASHAHTDLRTPSLRVAVHSGRNVASDFAVVQRAAPFLHHCTRPQLLVLFEGQSRFDEQGRRAWITPGSFSLSDPQRGGTDSFGGSASRWLVLDWDPAVLGAPFRGAAHIDRLPRQDLSRLEDASEGLTGPDPRAAVTSILAVFRSLGLDFARGAPDLAEVPITTEDERVHAACMDHLWDLEKHPAIGDVVDGLGASERHTHRRITAVAARYRLPWSHWRAALHYTRVLQAVRLLAAPAATTEGVARATGFRAPAALCHAFAKAGLPSPGALAQSARRHGLEGWGDLVPRADPEGVGDRDFAAQGASL